MYNLYRPRGSLGHDLASFGLRQTKQMEKCVKMLVHLKSSCEAHENILITLT